MGRLSRCMGVGKPKLVCVDNLFEILHYVYSTQRAQAECSSLLR
jgi:hypothetical protein